MAKIYDNIESKFVEGLQGIMTNIGVKRVDFCVGYFNLRGWNIVVDQVDSLTGDYIYENDERVFRKCRLLIGMHRPDEDIIRQLYTEQPCNQEKLFKERAKFHNGEAAFFHKVF